MLLLHCLLVCFVVHCMASDMPRKLTENENKLVQQFVIASPNGQEVERLCQCSDVDVNVLDLENNRPLSVALQTKRVGFAHERLYKYGLNLNLKDFTDQTLYERCLAYYDRLAHDPVFPHSYLQLCFLDKDHIRPDHALDKTLNLIEKVEQHVCRHMTSETPRCNSFGSYYYLTDLLKIREVIRVIGSAQEQQPSTATECTEVSLAHRPTNDTLVTDPAEAVDTFLAECFFGEGHTLSASVAPAARNLIQSMLLLTYQKMKEERHHNGPTLTPNEQHYHERIRRMLEVRNVVETLAGVLRTPAKAASAEPAKTDAVTMDNAKTEYGIKKRAWCCLL